jgi:hypothetical protein
LIAEESKVIENLPDHAHTCDPDDIIQKIIKESTHPSIQTEQFDHNAMLITFLAKKVNDILDFIYKFQEFKYFPAA